MVSLSITLVSENISALPKLTKDVAPEYNEAATVNACVVKVLVFSAAIVLITVADNLTVVPAGALNDICEFPDAKVGLEDVTSIKVPGIPPVSTVAT